MRERHKNPCTTPAIQYSTVKTTIPISGPNFRRSVQRLTPDSSNNFTQYGYVEYGNDYAYAICEPNLLPLVAHGMTLAHSHNRPPWFWYFNFGLLVAMELLK